MRCLPALRHKLFARCSRAIPYVTALVLAAAMLAPTLAHADPEYGDYWTDFVIKAVKVALRLLGLPPINI